MKFHCPCGFVHDLASEDHAFVVVPLKHYRDLLDSEWRLAALDPRAADHEQRRRELELLNLSLKQRARECPRCGRILWYRENLARPSVYWVDED